MRTECEVKQFFDMAGEDYENLRYPYMREIRAEAVRKELRGGLILDVGCNCGHLAGEYLSGQKLVGIDISLSCLKKANARCKGSFINASAQSLPFREKSFSSIVCSEALYYLKYPGVFLKDAYRLLIPGGKIIVLSSNQLYYNAGRWLGVLLKLRPKDINERAYYRGEIAGLLKASGFINIACYSKGVFPVRGFEFLDRTILNRLGFIHVVTGFKEGVNEDTGNKF